MAANMPMRIFTLSILALLTLELVPQQSVARFRKMNVQPRSRRGLLDSYLDDTPSSSAPNPGMTAELIPYHHVNSPFYQPNLTLAERRAVSAKRSRAQWMRINRQLENVNAPFTSPGVFFIGASYVLNFTIGTPARTYLAIADTGSDLCWVQCKGCDPCNEQPDQFFNPAASSTYKTVPCSDTLCTTISASDCNSNHSCRYQYPYGDGSIDTNGTLSKETLTLYNSHRKASKFGAFYFGCGLDQIGFEFEGLSDFDGFVGLGQGPLSLVSQLGSAIDYKFSYCLVDDIVANLTSPLLFGSVGSLPLNYTTLLANPSVNPTFYYLDIQGIAVGGYKLSYDDRAFAIYDDGSGGIILDSGTLFTYLTEDVYPLLLQQLRKQISYTETDAKPYGLDLCYNTSNVGDVAFPDVAFTLGNLVLTPNPNENIFGDFSGDRSVFCLQVVSTPSGTTSILGNVWQQNYQIAYDLSKKTVGFAPTQCGNPSH